MICARCKRPIKANEQYRHMDGMGEVHSRCPADAQMGLVADEEELPIDHVPESYPD